MSEAENDSIARRDAARLVHPGLAWVLDVAQADGMDYLVMRYVAGDSVIPLSGQHAPGGRRTDPRSRDRDGGGPPGGRNPSRPEAVEHRRDPGRIPVVIDFGLAVLMDDPEPRPTDPGQFVGTLAFASPEQLRGDAAQIGPHSDIFALGCVLYERLARRLPFPIPARVDVSDPIDASPAPPSAYRVEVDPALDAICLKALAHEPTDRYGSMAALAADLYAYLERDLGPAPARRPRAGPMTSPSPSLRRDVIRFVFVGAG